LLRAQKRAAVDVETITFSQAVSSPDQLWQGILAGTLRASALVRSQPEAKQQQIRAAFYRLLQPYRVQNRLEVPAVVKLATATKPHR
jgi:hypothetical protein